MRFELTGADNNNQSVSEVIEIKLKCKLEQLSDASNEIFLQNLIRDWPRPSAISHRNTALIINKPKLKLSDLRSHDLAHSPIRSHSELGEEYLHFATKQQVQRMKNRNHDCRQQHQAYHHHNIQYNEFQIFMVPERALEKLSSDNKKSCNSSALFWVWRPHSSCVIARLQFDSSSNVRPTDRPTSWPE